MLSTPLQTLASKCRTLKYRTKYNPLSTVQDMTQHWGEGFRIENLEVDSEGIYKLDFITHYVRNLEPTRWGHVALSWRINIEGRGDAQNSIGGDFKLTQTVFNAPVSWCYPTIVDSCFDLCLWSSVRNIVLLCHHLWRNKVGNEGGRAYIMNHMTRFQVMVSNLSHGVIKNLTDHRIHTGKQNISNEPFQS